LFWFAVWFRYAKLLVVSGFVFALPVVLTSCKWGVRQPCFGLQFGADMPESQITLNVQAIAKHFKGRNRWSMAELGRQVPLPNDNKQTRQRFQNWLKRCSAGGYVNRQHKSTAEFEHALRNFVEFDHSLYAEDVAQHLESWDFIRDDTNKMVVLERVLRQHGVGRTLSTFVGQVASLWSNANVEIRDKMFHQVRAWEQEVKEQKTIEEISLANLDVKQMMIVWNAENELKKTGPVSPMAEQTLKRLASEGKTLEEILHYIKKQNSPEMVGES